MSNFVTTIGGTMILYYTKKGDVIRLMWNFFLSFSIGLVVGLILVAGPLIKTIKMAMGLLHCEEFGYIDIESIKS